ncbi:hypothetical protein PoB_007417800 [Plakobranchus ocellatus]|uniref:NR LBD domain-containing protein n=1 Tax=Plakobranchus ocellatus TaxID=259542 RepID=A0AAV4DTP5_9GAST|nr:hypothetical protein PoB_007417800 [Plakobranchus ocellatus]
MLFDVAESLKRLKLKPKEHIITQTMCLLFPDRAPLKNRPAVEALQAMLLSCLEYLVSQRPTAEERVRALGHAIDMQTFVRKLSLVDSFQPVKASLMEYSYRLKISFLTEEMGKAP